MEKTMAISLSDLKTVRADKPPRVLIYGPPKMGKTTLASEFPNAVFLQIEEGEGTTDITSFGKLATFGEVMDALAALYTEDHGYGTVVVDSITELQRLIFAETCERGDEKGNAKANIEDFGYGKGYVYALRIWTDFLDGINALRRDKGMGIVLIAHSRVKRFDDPETVSYDRYEIDLHEKAVGMIEREMDAIFLLKRPVIVKQDDVGFNKKRSRADSSGDARLIYAQGTNAFVAGNRYDMPPSFRYDRGQGFAVLAPYFPGAAPAAEQKEAA
jgi:hypothetical protein